MRTPTASKHGGPDGGRPEEFAAEVRRARRDAAALLGVVTGYAELLGRDPAASERERAALAETRRHVEDALGALERLLVRLDRERWPELGRRTRPVHGRRA